MEALNMSISWMKLLDLETIGFISPNLAEKILEYSCEMSYREVAQAISTLTNQVISHQAVWNISCPRRLADK